MKAQVHLFEDIQVGDRASFTKVWSKEDVATFVLLSGDENPLHTEEVYASTTRFGKPIVHGMLVASSFSTLVGMYLPGTYCLYVKQDISFKKPVYVGDGLLVEGTVVRKIESTKMLEIQCSVSREGVPVVEGVALVQVQEPYE
jgi:3-hydroxybutyryl-CoA dehydratase